MTGRDTYVAANRAAWDASADYHRGNDSWLRNSAGFATPGYSCLDRTLTAALQEIGVDGRDVAQLCCNNGREILSVKGMGARRCVGFDQSAAFLAQARELAALGPIDCEFVETDVYRIPAGYDAAFDLVLVTIGVFGWMPDLAAFLAVAARLLRPGGRFLVYEEHPVMNIFDPRSATPMEPTGGYFRAEPEAEESAIVYDGSETNPVPEHFWFFHTLADVISGAIAAGLAIRSLREYPHNINTVEYDIYEERGIGLPMAYVLTAQKE